MKEVTYEDWQKNPTPRMMWVWDNDDDVRKRKVIYINGNMNAEYSVIAMTEDEIGAIKFRHCAEIEEPKTRRMTNQELAWWLRDGKHREYIHRVGGYVHFEYMYRSCVAEDTVDDSILIREDGGEWREPLVEVEG